MFLFSLHGTTKDHHHHHRIYHPPSYTIHAIKSLFLYFYLGELGCFDADRSPFNVHGRRRGYLIDRDLSDHIHTYIHTYIHTCSQYDKERKECLTLSSHPSGSCDNSASFASSNYTHGAKSDQSVRRNWRHYNTFHSSTTTTTAYIHLLRP